MCVCACVVCVCDNTCVPAQWSCCVQSYGLFCLIKMCSYYLAFSNHYVFVFVYAEPPQKNLLIITSLLFVTFCFLKGAFLVFYNKTPK